MSAEERSSELQREHRRQLAQWAVGERPITEAIEFETPAAKRAQSETFDVERTGYDVSSVRTANHGNADEHGHRVTVKNGVSVFRASLADTSHESACTRHLAIVVCESDLEIASSSEGNREPEIVTDGGRAIDHSPAYEQRTDRRPMDCDCLPTFDDLPCWPCYRKGFRLPNPNATSDE